MAGVAYTPAQLEAMDLSPANLQHPVEVVGIGSYQRRLTLQNAVKTTNHEGRIPILGDKIFATQPPNHQQSTRCNYLISLVQCNGSIPGAGANGVDLAIAADTYMFLEEQKLWTENNLTASLGQDKHSQHLLMASTPAGYPVDKYFKFIPKNVLVSNGHQTAYLNKRKVAHQALTMDMIADLYITFKCNHEVTHQDEYDEHTELVHGTTPAKLRALKTSFSPLPSFEYRACES